MVGWMDDEALHRTLTTGRVTFWSRSRAGVLAQGRHLGPRPAGQATVALDCDGDALLVAGRPGRGRLPHRRPDLLRRPRAAASARDTATPDPTAVPETAAAATPATAPACSRRRPQRTDAGPALRRTWPTLATFRELARDRRVIPVVRRLLADAETPVGVYRKLAKDRPGTFLLESAEHGGVWSRYSFVGAALPGHADRARRRGALDRASRRSACPPPATRSRRCATRSPRCATDAPARAAAADRRHGRLRRLRRRAPLGDGCPTARRTTSHLPELAMMLATDLAVLDHADGVAAAGRQRGQLRRHRRAGRRGLAGRRRPARRDDRRPRPPGAQHGRGPRADRRRRPRATTRPEQFHADGRGGQGGDPRRRGVPGRALPAVLASTARPTRWTSTGCCARPTPARTCTSCACPAPDGTAYDVVGSSPEALVKVTGRRAITHPIAGSRPRGATPEEDAAYGEDLLADAKERAEHVMLVDLARNDLSRVCEPGTVEVVEFMTVEPLQPRHAPRVHRRRRHPARPDARTTCCAPRSRPAPCPARRSPGRWSSSTSSSPAGAACTAGSVGYLDFAGDLDMAIAIRTAVIKDGVAYVQAGGGIVADSVPQLEREESSNKAAAALRAVATAAGLRAP